MILSGNTLQRPCDVFLYRNKCNILKSNLVVTHMWHCASECEFLSPGFHYPEIHVVHNNVLKIKKTRWRRTYIRTIPVSKSTLPANRLSFLKWIRTSSRIFTFSSRDKLSKSKKIIKFHRINVRWGNLGNCSELLPVLKSKEQLSPAACPVQFSQRRSGLGLFVLAVQVLRHKIWVWRVRKDKG